MKTVKGSWCDMVKIPRSTLDSLERDARVGRAAKKMYASGFYSKELGGTHTGLIFLSTEDMVEWSDTD